MSLFSTPEQDPSTAAKPHAGTAAQGSSGGILRAGAVYASLCGEGRRGGGAAAGREQATTTHSGTFHDPAAAPGKHQSLHPLEFPAAVPERYL